VVDVGLNVVDARLQAQVGDVDREDERRRLAFAPKRLVRARVPLQVAEQPGASATARKSQLCRPDNEFLAFGARELTCNRSSGGIDCPSPLGAQAPVDRPAAMDPGQEKPPELTRFRGYLAT